MAFPCYLVCTAYYCVLWCVCVFLLCSQDQFRPSQLRPYSTSLMFCSTRAQCCCSGFFAEQRCGGGENCEPLSLGLREWAASKVIGGLFVCHKKTLAAALDHLKPGVRLAKLIRAPISQPKASSVSPFRSPFLSPLAWHCWALQTFSVVVAFLLIASHCSFVCTVQRRCVVSAVFSSPSFWCPAVSAPKSSQSFQFLKLSVASLLAVEGELFWHKGTSREFVAQCSAPPVSFFSTSVSSALTSACFTSVDRFRTNLSRIRRVVAAPVCLGNSLAKCIVGACWSSSCSLAFLTHLSCVKVC